MLLNVIMGTIDLFVQMSPYLLFGFLFAGLLHIFVPLEWIAKHLGSSSIGSVFKAVIFGIPLPLCSCGVIPAAVLLRKKGASRGAVLSFLIATPITGVDSILATYSLLGWFFTLYRILAAGLTAFVAGIAANIFLGKDQATTSTPAVSSCCHKHDKTDEATVTEVEKSPRPPWFRELFRYAFDEVLGEIWKTLLIGLLIGGLITALVPASLIQNYLGSPWLSMLIMMIVGIPMYICATGSIPIASALMLKGLSPGAALVLLLAGPATNAVTIAVVTRELGKRAVTIYLLAIASVSLLCGWLLNVFFLDLAVQGATAHTHSSMLSSWIERGSALLLAGVIVWHILKTFRRR